MTKLILLFLTHTLVALVGFAGGIYTLPLLTAPSPPSAGEMAAASNQALFSGQFRRELADSDFLHWGEGKLSVSKQFVVFEGQLSPGPDFRLYLSPEFIETEADFVRMKSQMVQVGEVKTFDGFILPLSDSIDPVDYNTAIIWCESFGQFISAARYR
ncbi:DM13 domain-containing protein [Marinobacterium arenosum]|uniref:DM13 domain-containing protein n=1 Tax=Marinobacterium arenosum TaxID=2862496 RepID=UPI001C93FC03|nr:DM13 domain-containing protein [Marinobacterium arenosum]MBY4678580.1 DM13 domain-containing protein [Marinobacterium arenosum]